MANTLTDLMNCPLDKVWNPGHHGSEDANGIEIERATALCLVQLSLFPDTTKPAMTVLRKLGITKLPAIPTMAEIKGATTILPFGANRFLIACDDYDFADKLAKAMPAKTGSVTDLSGARVHLKLSGSAVERILSTGMAIDFHLSNFPVGHVAQSAVHHMPVLVHRTGKDAFSLYAFATYAESTFHWLLEASLPHGADLI